MCAGVTQLLRELRRAVTPAGEAAAAAEARGEHAASVEAAALAALAPQLRLLALCSDHERVASEARRLAAGEGTIERLLHLLAPAEPPPSEPATASKAKAKAKAGGGGAAASSELLVAAAALLGALSGGDGRSKALLLPHKAALCRVLTRHIGSSSMPLAEQVVTAVGNLSSHKVFRAELIAPASAKGEPAALPALLRLLSTTAVGEGEAVLMPNALAAVHNCSLQPDALALIVNEQTADALLPRLTSPSVALVRRAAAVVAKCAVRLPSVVEALVAGEALPALVRAVVSEGASYDAAADEPRIVDVTETGAADAADADAAASEEAAATEEEMVGSALRILTACAARKEGAALICEGGGLPAIAKLLQRDDTSLKGNAALCLAECAREERCLAVLAVQPIVPPLLAIAHNEKGATQKNAAIALGRLAKNPRCLQAIRDNHGIEILARAMKGQFGPMGIGA